MNVIIPFVYLFKSRLTRNVERLSWVLINPIALFLVTGLLSDLTFIEHFILFILAFLAWQSLYEIGYIYNDVFTSKKETNPTLRLGAKDAIFIEKKFALIVMCKLVISALSIIVVFWFDQYANLHLHVLWFLGILSLSSLAFSIHNSMRNRFNILTFGVLSATKYMALPLLMVAEGQEFVGFLVSLTMFPLVRTLEHATKNKYSLGRLKKIVGDFTLFRVKYYAFAFFLACLVHWFMGEENTIIFIAIYAYFLIYRIGVWFVIRKKIVHQTVHRSY